MQYKVLEANLIDLIKEEQAKLGYRKEAIRLYYPARSLQHLLNTDLEVEEMQKELEQGLPLACADTLGNITVTHENDRFCICIPENGSEWVHAHMSQNEFIVELIQLVARHDCTIQKIKELFEKQHKKFVVEEVTNGEFDVLLRFTEGEDSYYYCFKDEGFHIIYHRFLPDDYKDFDF